MEQLAAEGTSPHCFWAGAPGSNWLARVWNPPGARSTALNHIGLGVCVIAEGPFDGGSCCMLVSVPAAGVPSCRRPCGGETQGACAQPPVVAANGRRGGVVKSFSGWSPPHPPIGYRKPVEEFQLHQFVCRGLLCSGVDGQHVAPHSGQFRGEHWRVSARTVCPSYGATPRACPPEFLSSKAGSSQNLPPQGAPVDCCNYNNYYQQAIEQGERGEGREEKEDTGRTPGECQHRSHCLHNPHYP